MRWQQNTEQVDFGVFPESHTVYRLYSSDVCLGRLLCFRV